MVWIGYYHRLGTRWGRKASDSLTLITLGRIKNRYLTRHNPQH